VVNGNKNSSIPRRTQWALQLKPLFIIRFDPRGFLYRRDVKRIPLIATLWCASAGLRASSLFRLPRSDCSSFWSAKKKKTATRQASASTTATDFEFLRPYRTKCPVHELLVSNRPLTRPVTSHRPSTWLYAAVRSQNDVFRGCDCGLRLLAWGHCSKDRAMLFAGTARIQLVWAGGPRAFAAGRPLYCKRTMPTCTDRPSGALFWLGRLIPLSSSTNHKDNSKKNAPTSSNKNLPVHLQAARHPTLAIGLHFSDGLAGFLWASHSLH